MQNLLDLINHPEHLTKSDYDFFRTQSKRCPSSSILRLMYSISAKHFCKKEADQEYARAIVLGMNSKKAIDYYQLSFCETDNEELQIQADSISHSSSEEEQTGTVYEIKSGISKYEEIKKEETLKQQAEIISSEMKVPNPMIEKNQVESSQKLVADVKIPLKDKEVIKSEIKETVSGNLSDADKRKKELELIIAQRLASIKKKDDVTSVQTLNQNIVEKVEKPLQAEIPSSKDTKVKLEKSNSPKVDIDGLIKELNQNPPKKRMNPNGEYSYEDLGKESVAEYEDNISETLADVYIKQGNLKKAVYIYQKLQLLFPEKSCYFAKKIEEL